MAILLAQVTLTMSRPTHDRQRMNTSDVLVAIKVQHALPPSCDLLCAGLVDAPKSSKRLKR